MGLAACWWRRARPAAICSASSTSSGGWRSRSPAPLPPRSPVSISTNGAGPFDLILADDRLVDVRGTPFAQLIGDDRRLGRSRLIVIAVDRPSCWPIGAVVQG